MSQEQQVHITIKELSEKIGFDEEDVQALLEMFLRNIDQQLENMYQSILKEDASTLSDVAHSIKGSSGNIGLDHIYKLSTEIETAAKASNFDTMQKDHATLVEMIETLKKDIS